MGEFVLFVPRWAETVLEQGGNVSPVCLRYTAVHRGSGLNPKRAEASSCPCAHPHLHVSRLSFVFPHTCFAHLALETREGILQCWFR